MAESVKILHLETSTEVCSIAISADLTVVGEVNEVKGFAHSERGTLMVQESLQQAGLDISDLDAVSISQGPGSYTGLRVGFAMAKGICFAQDIPMLCVPTLKAIAYGVKKEERKAVLTPMLDARRMEVYAESFDLNLKTISALEALVLDETSYAERYHKNENNLFLGDGAHKVEKWLRPGQDEILQQVCLARNQIELAHEMFHGNELCDIAYSKPLYLKPPNITVSKKKLLS